MWPSNSFRSLATFTSTSSPPCRVLRSRPDTGCSISIDSRLTWRQQIVRFKICCHSMYMVWICIWVALIIELAIRIRQYWALSVLSTKSVLFIEPTTEKRHSHRLWYSCCHCCTTLSVAVYWVQDRQKGRSLQCGNLLYQFFQRTKFYEVEEHNNSEPVMYLVKKVNIGSALRTSDTWNTGPIMMPCYKYKRVSLWSPSQSHVQSSSLHTSQSHVQSSSVHTSQSHVQFFLLQHCLWVLLVRCFQLAPQLLIHCLPLWAAFLAELPD